MVHSPSGAAIIPSDGYKSSRSPFANRCCDNLNTPSDVLQLLTPYRGYRIREARGAGAVDASHFAGRIWRAGLNAYRPIVECTHYRVMKEAGGDKG